MRLEGIHHDWPYVGENRLLRPQKFSTLLLGCGFVLSAAGGPRVLLHASARPFGTNMGQAESQQKGHNRDNERQIGKPGRVGGDERRHGIEHQEDGERSERDALRQRQPGTGGIEPGGDLLDPCRHQRSRQRQERSDRREAITVSMAAMTARPTGSRNDQSRMDMQYDRLPAT